MSRKRIYYLIDPPNGWWWVTGQNKPLHINNPLFGKKNFSSQKTVRTMKRAMKILASCPIGTIVTRVRHTRHKKGIFVLMEFEKTS